MPWSVIPRLPGKTLLSPPDSTRWAGIRDFQEPFIAAVRQTGGMSAGWVIQPDHVPIIEFQYAWWNLRLHPLIPGSEIYGPPNDEATRVFVTV